MAMGIAFAGGKPVAEIQFCDYIFNVIDLLKLCGNIHWSSAGEYHLPLVVMTPVGSGIHGSMYHSHSFESMATHIPGWKIVMPSNAKDAYGLLLSAIAEPNPVLFMAPKALMRAKGDELIPGEPADEKTLNAMINAPLGDRTDWQGLSIEVVDMDGRVLAATTEGLAIWQDGKFQLAGRTTGILRRARRRCTRTRP